MIKGKTSPRECGEHFGISDAEVYEHINNHELKIDVNTGKVDSPDFYMGRLLGMIETMDEWVRLTMEVNDFDANRIRAGTSLMREIRETLKTLAEFQGVKETGGNYSIQITQIKQEYIALTNFIMEEACDSCRAKIIDVMGIEPKLVSTT